MRKKYLTTAITLALSFGCTHAFAETIIRIVDRSQIEQTGSLSTAALISNLTSQQGGTTLLSSINGGAKGEVTASIHGMGDRYTTILLNGRRMADNNLNVIPLSWIDYIEISSGSLNGAGSSNVINLVTKKGLSEFEVEFAYGTPQQDTGGKTNNFSISKGFGDVNKDGFNMSLTYAHDEQRSLNAADREFSKNGALTKFKDGAKSYSFYLPSSANQPANVALFGGGISSFNPYLVANGDCPRGDLKIGNRCFVDYAANVDLVPATKNTSLAGALKIRLNDATSVFFEGLQSKTSVNAAYSYSAQSMTLEKSEPMFQKYILPAYTAAGGSQTSKLSGASINMRLIDAGRRTDLFDRNTKNFVTGIETKMGGWSIDGSYVYSESKVADIADGGYLSKNRLMQIINTGNWNPFAVPTYAGSSAISPAVLHQELVTETKKLSILNIAGSRKLASTTTLNFSIESGKESVIDSPSAIAQGANPMQPNFNDYIVGGMYGAMPFDASRTNWAVQTEIDTQVTKGLNLSAGGRFDSFSAVKNNRAFDDNSNPIASSTQGAAQRASSFHLDATFRPLDNLSILANISTHVSSPALKDISAPTLNAGYSRPHSFIGCIVVGGTFIYQLKELCQNDYLYPQEFQLISGGNAESSTDYLKLEKISEYRLGFTFNPPDHTIEIKASLWGAAVKNQISMLTEDDVFGEPMRFQPNFVSFFDPAKQSKVLAVRLTPMNLGTSTYQGLDFDNSYRADTALGKMRFNWSGTYMLKSTATVNGQHENNIGRFNSKGDVTFKLISKLTTIWYPSNKYTHSLSLNYQSGYRDMPVNAEQAFVRSVNTDGTLGDFTDLSRSVKSYYTFDWQSKINLNKNLTMTAGIKNLFNQDPPFSVRNIGGGMALGYDGRYTDPLGRQFYVVGNLKF